MGFLKGLESGLEWIIAAVLTLFGWALHKIVRYGNRISTMEHRVERLEEQSATKEDVESLAKLTCQKTDGLHQYMVAGFDRTNNTLDQIMQEMLRRDHEKKTDKE